MGYIGTTPNTGRFRKVDDISSSFNGSTTSFLITIGGTVYTPPSVLQMSVAINGAVKEPLVDWNLSGSSIVFAVAPTNGQKFQGVIYGDIGTAFSTAASANYVIDGNQANITSLGNLTALQVDNVNVDVNTISTTNTNGNLNLTPNGTGQVVLSKGFTSTIATGTPPFVVNSTTPVPNLVVATATSAGTVTTAAQPNITSVGTLTSLQVANINLATNTISTTNTNGNLNLTPNGTGNILLGPNIAVANTTVTSGTGNLTINANLTAVTASANNTLYSVFRMNDNTISASATIPASMNATATGPLLIANGITLDVQGELSII